MFGLCCYFNKKYQQIFFDYLSKPLGTSAVNANALISTAGICTIAMLRNVTLKGTLLF